MSVSVTWDDDEQTVMRWVFEGNWTWEEYYTNRDAANTQVAEKAYRVDMIVDMRNSKALPSGAMTHGKNAVSSVTPDNLGVTVFVGVNPVLRTFYTMFSRLYGSLLTNKHLDTVMVATLEEAYEVIQKRQGIGA